MSDSFVTVFSGFVCTKGSNVGRRTGQTCNALNLGRGITINGDYCCYEVGGHVEGLQN